MKTTPYIKATWIRNSLLVEVDGRLAADEPCPAAEAAAAAAHIERRYGVAVEYFGPMGKCEVLNG